MTATALPLDQAVYASMRRAAFAFDEALRRQGVVLTMRRYGCCACQKVHYDDESLYLPHLMAQSKHGWEAISAAQAAVERWIGRATKKGGV